MDGRRGRWTAPLNLVGEWTNAGGAYRFCPIGAEVGTQGWLVETPTPGGSSMTSPKTLSGLDPTITTREVVFTVEVEMETPK